MKVANCLLNIKLLKNEEEMEEDGSKNNPILEQEEDSGTKKEASNQILHFPENSTAEYLKRTICQG